MSEEGWVPELETERLAVLRPLTGSGWIHEERVDAAQALETRIAGREERLAQLDGELDQLRAEAYASVQRELAGQLGDWLRVAELELGAWQRRWIEQLWQRRLRPWCARFAQDSLALASDRLPAQIETLLEEEVLEPPIRVRVAPDAVELLRKALSGLERMLLVVEDSALSAGELLLDHGAGRLELTIASVMSSLERELAHPPAALSPESLSDAGWLDGLELGPLELEG